MYATVGMRTGIMIDVVASDDRPGLRRSRQHDGTPKSTTCVWRWQEGFMAEASTICGAPSQGQRPTSQPELPQPHNHIVRRVH